MHEFARLRPDDLGDLRMRIAQGHHADSAQEVEILAAVFGKQVCAFTVRHQHRMPVVSMEQKFFFRLLYFAQTHEAMTSVPQSILVW